MTFLKIGLFGLSTLGTFQLVRRISKDRIDVYFLPSLTIAIQVAILFFAGILNLLPEVSKMLYLAGLLALGASLWRNKGIQFVRDYINDGYISSFLIMVVMGASVRGKLFSHYDNFSHWAMVVRHMLEVNHYPNFESTLIVFQEYPLGRATYIYYFAKMISHSESVQMMAQLYMIVAAVLVLFSFVSKRSLWLDILYFAIVNFILVYNIRVGDLLVDTLLPAVGVAAFLFEKKYCIYESSKLHFWLLSCYLVQLIQIKNSGIFFVAAIIIVGSKHYWCKENRLNNVCAGVLPLLSLLVWHKHCKYVFAAASTSKHAMTVENYRAVIGDKTVEDIKAICVGVFRLSVMTKDAAALLAIALLLGSLIWIFKKDDWKDYKKCFLFTFIFYVCYQAGMLGMYLFSMPIGEAASLAGGERYLRTVIMAIFIIYMAFAIKAFSDINLNEQAKRFSVGILTLSVVAFSYFTQGKIVLAPTTVKNDATRLWIEENKDMYAVPMHNSYCILIPERDSGYTAYLLKYIFQSKKVASIIVDDADDLKSIRNKYIFIYDRNNDTIDKWLKEKYPDQYGNNVIVSEDT